MDRRTIRTRAAIRKSYFALLTEKNDGRVSVSDVARRANIDRKTFYLHYSTPEDILQEFYREKVEEFFTRLSAEAEKGEPMKLEQALTVLNRLMGENLSLLEIVAAQKQADYFFDQIRENLTEAIVKEFGGRFAVTETELRVLLQLYLAGFFSVYKRWVLNGIPMSIDDLARVLKSAVLYGVQSLTEPKG